MIQGLEYNGLSSDIWSIGVILFAMVCGYLPFDDQDTQILYQRIIDGEYSIPSNISNEASDLIRRVLNVDPDQRYTIEQIRQHQWFKFSPGY